MAALDQGAAFLVRLKGRIISPRTIPQAARRKRMEN